MLFKQTFYFLKLSQLLSVEDALNSLSKEPLFTKRLKICQDNFDRLAGGSSRIVFQLPNNMVLKLAKNQKGLLQNRVEDDGFLHQSYLVNSPVKSDPNYYWIVVPHAKKITETEFANKTGINWKEFCESIKYWKDTFIKNKKENMPNNFDKINQNDFFQEVINLIGSMQLASGDIRRISSWGEVDGQIKLIDAGLTDDIYQSYYKK